jgi:CHASE2 domain-containing sensor protein
MMKSRKLVLLKWLFLLLGVLFVSWGISSSGWRKPTAIIIGAAEIISGIVLWRRENYPFDPDETIPKKRTLQN